MRFAVKDGRTTSGWRLQQPGGEETKADGTIVHPGSKGWTAALALSCGFTAVQGERPTDQPEAQHRWTRTLVDIDGAPWFEWTQEPFTADEIAAGAQEAAIAATKAAQNEEMGLVVPAAMAEMAKRQNVPHTPEEAAAKWKLPDEEWVDITVDDDLVEAINQLGRWLAHVASFNNNAELAFMQTLMLDAQEG